MKFNYDKILQINAEKSYKWKLNKGIDFLKNPALKVPFIPAFSLDTKNILNNSTLTNINVLNYGHCDILDTAFSNLMHNSFAEGIEDRTKLFEYRLLLIEIIKTFINDIDFNDELLLNDLNKFNIEFTIN